MNISYYAFRPRGSPCMHSDASARELLAILQTANPVVFLEYAVTVMCCWDLHTSEESPHYRWLVKRQGMSLLALGLGPYMFRSHVCSGKSILLEHQSSKCLLNYL